MKKKSSLHVLVLVIAYVFTLLAVPLQAAAVSSGNLHFTTEELNPNVTWWEGTNVTSSELYAGFSEPADNMSSKPLFFWNTPVEDMTEEQLREIVRRSYEESGYSGFGILPFWQEDYFTDRYFALYEAALDEGAKYGMKFSLYDENGFPSYTAGGLFAEKYPHLTAKRLDMVESSTVENGKIYMRLPQEKLMGAVAYNTLTNEIIDITDQAVLADLPELDTATLPVGVFASSEYGAGYEVEKAFDGDRSTRWNAADQSGSGEYVIINFGAKTKLDTVELFEDDNPILHCVKKFAVEYWDTENENWVVLGSGKTIKSEGATVSFAAVTEQYYRIYFHQVDGGSVSINEINLYADGQKLAKPSAVPANKEVGYFSSSEFSADYNAQKAFDGDAATRWAAVGDTDQWISAMFAKPVTIDSVKIQEIYDRITSFEIQYYDNGTWKKCAEGTTVGENFEVSFEAVTTTGLRLYIHNAPGWASIVEFKMFCAGEQVVVHEMGYASSTEFSADYNAEKAFDNDLGTRWAAAGDTDQWISIMFGEKLTVDSVKIQEVYDRITSFEIQYYDNGAWIKCAEGTTIGNNFELSFAPVTTAGLRLYIHNAPGWASIVEFQVFSNGKQVMQEDEAEGEYKGSYIEYPVEGDGWKLMAFLCVTDGVPGMDYLSEEAVAGFIQITYDEYYNRFKKYFDNGTITSAFYDEPSFRELADILTTWGVSGSRMWTDDFNEEFAEMFGQDINPVLYYPALWYDIGDKTTEARDKLNAVRTELFAKNYIGQVNQWCQDHGIELMGHMLSEDQDNPVSFHGDLMYCFKYQDCPTVDVIGHYGMTEDYYKIISSSAYNWDHPHVGVECYGAINDMPVDALYKTAMDLFAKGINVMVPHAVWYDAESYWFQPELSYRTEPYASALPQYNQYIARLQTMLQEGRHVADIAVLYPIDTLEYDYNFNKNNEFISEYSNYIALTEQLSEKIRLDYTYIHPSVLDENVTIEGTTLQLNNQNNYEAYKVMIIPSIRVISRTNLEKINAFYQNGGIVISVGDLPRMGTEETDNAAIQSLIQEMFGEAWDTAQTKSIARTNDKGGKIYHLTDLGSFESVLKQAYDRYDVNISPVPESNGHLTYIHKVISGLNVYFFANSSEIAVKPTVTLRGEFENLEVWNPVTGERYAIATTVEDGMTTFELNMNSVTSLFVVEGDGTAEEAPGESEPSEPSTEGLTPTFYADFGYAWDSDAFDFYNHSEVNPAAVVNGVLRADAANSSKAIIKDLIFTQGTVETVVAMNDSDVNINSGIYLFASAAADEQDTITAYNVEIESAPDSKDLTVCLYSFDGKYIGKLKSVTLTNHFADGTAKAAVKLMVKAFNGVLTVCVNDNAVITYTVGALSGGVGLRSHYAGSDFDYIRVYETATEYVAPDTENLEALFLDAKALLSGTEVEGTDAYTGKNPYVTQETYDALEAVVNTYDVDLIRAYERHVVQVEAILTEGIAQFKQGILLPAVAQVGEHTYASVTEAIAAANGATVKVLMDTEEEITIHADVTIDLAGNSLSNVTVAEGSLKLIDTVTGGTAAVTGSVETFTEADGKTYLVVGENGVYSAHAYSIAITHISLDPSNDALGYKAKLTGDEVVQQAVTGIGFNLWVDGGNVKTYTTTGKQEVTLRLKNILAAGGGEMNINATAFVILGDHTETTQQQTTTMKQALQLVNDNWDSYSQTQRDAVKALCDKHAVTQTWGLTNICPEANVA